MTERQRLDMGVESLHHHSARRSIFYLPTTTKQRSVNHDARQHLHHRAFHQWTRECLVTDRARIAAPADGPRSHTRVFIVKLRAPNDNDAAQKLRALLKIALRRFDLRCVAIAEEPQPPEQTTPDAHGAP